MKIALYIGGLLLAWQSFGQSKDYYLFTSFRGNGKDGLHYAISQDGYLWTPLNDDKSFLPPQINHPDNLMRDPCLKQGPDGTFHLVWTVSWNCDHGKILGYASSKDLLHWTPQQTIPVMESEEKVRNVWAPELFYDEKRKDWIIYWASTITGKFEEDSSNLSENKYNHRIFYVRTKDFKSFSPTQLMFNPNINIIDATILEDKGKFYLFYKDERLKPLKKNLRIARATNVLGPYEDAKESFTKNWIEGPSAIKIGDAYFVYYDFYRKSSQVPPHYGAYMSKDLEHWEDVYTNMSFPKDQRHGTVIKISTEIATNLMKK